MDLVAPSTAGNKHSWWPAGAAFLVSLFLSATALYFNPVLGRDSAFYIDLADIYVSSGLSAVLERFNWPWLSVLVGLLHKFSGASLIASGYALMALLMAGLCAALVRLTSKLRPEAAWWGVLVAVAIPAFNAYRDGILREPGFWLFCTLTLHCVLNWQRSHKHRWVLLAIISVAAAMMFRLEAIFLLGAIGIAITWRYRRTLLARRRSLAGVLLLTLLVLGAMLAASLSLADDNSRIAYYLTLLDPARLFGNLLATAERFAQSSLADYSHEHAGVILLGGFLTVILMFALTLCGPFMLVFLRGLPPSTRETLVPAAPFLLAALGLYACVLLVFFIQNNFMIGRYVALAHVLATPAIAVIAQDFARRFQRSGWLVVALGAIFALANVVSLSDKRTHYLEAGAWIEANLPAEAQIHYDDQRISFYAGRGYRADRVSERDVVEGDIGQFDFLVLDDGPTHPRIEHLLNQERAEVLATFRNEGRREVTILRRLR